MPPRNTVEREDLVAARLSGRYFSAPDREVIVMESTPEILGFVDGVWPRGIHQPNAWIVVMRVWAPGVPNDEKHDGWTRWFLRAGEKTEHDALEFARGVMGRSAHVDSAGVNTTISRQ